MFGWRDVWMVQCLGLSFTMKVREEWTGKWVMCGWSKLETCTFITCFCDSKLINFDIFALRIFFVLERRWLFGIWVCSISHFREVESHPWREVIIEISRKDMTLKILCWHLFCYLLYEYTLHFWKMMGSHCVLYILLFCILFLNEFVKIFLKPRYLI